MNLDPALLNTLISILGTAVLAGVGFILRSLSKQTQTMNLQSQALSVLVARVDPAINNYAALENKVSAIASDVAYLKGTHAPQP